MEDFGRGFSPLTGGLGEKPVHPRRTVPQQAPLWRTTTTAYPCVFFAMAMKRIDIAVLEELVDCFHQTYVSLSKVFYEN